MIIRALGNILRGACIKHFGTFTDVYALIIIIARYILYYSLVYAYITFVK